MSTATSDTTSVDRPGLGVILMLGFCVLAPMSDAAGKHLAIAFPVLELVWVRFVVQTLVLGPVVWFSRRSFRMSRLAWKLTALRTALQIAGIWLMITGLTYLPLADALAIAFVMPFILLIMGHYFLGEQVGRRRMIACAIGFVGTLMVMQPSFAAVGWPVLYPLGVAFVFAAFMLVTRRMAHEVDPIAMQATSGAIATFAIGAVYIAMPQIGAFALVPPGDALWLFVVMGLLGTAGHLLMTWSLQFAAASTLAPMQYLEIPAAAIIGFLVFAEWPNGLAMAGIAVTIATGIYIVLRENSATKKDPA